VAECVCAQINITVIETYDRVYCVNTEITGPARKMLVSKSASLAVVM
jgi:hypothetical protein